MQCLPKHRRTSPHPVVLAAAAGVMLVTPPCLLVVSAQTKLTVTGAPEAKVESGRRQFQSHAGNEMQTGVASGERFRVFVRSYETAAIGAEVNARITHLPQREGDRFRKGDIIVAFDCSKIIAEKAAAIAIYNAHQAIHDNQKKMQRYGAAGTLAVDQARFEMEKAMADVNGLEAKRASCTIHAPFDGRVTEKAAQVHEIAQPNQPLIRIINESKLELVLMVPSAWLARVNPGSRFLVKIDENGETHQARIVQSTGLIDPVSQSARLIAEIVNPASSVLPGMSGTAVFSRQESQP